MNSAVELKLTEALFAMSCRSWRYSPPLTRSANHLMPKFSPPMTHKPWALEFLQRFKKTASFVIFIFPLPRVSVFHRRYLAVQRSSLVETVYIRGFQAPWLRFISGATIFLTVAL